MKGNEGRDALSVFSLSPGPAQRVCSKEKDALHATPLPPGPAQRAD